MVKDIWLVCLNINNGKSAKWKGKCILCEPAPIIIIFFFKINIDMWPDLLALCMKVFDEILEQVDTFLDLDFIDFEEVL